MCDFASTLIKRTQVSFTHTLIYLCHMQQATASMMTDHIYTDWALIHNSQDNSYLKDEHITTARVNMMEMVSGDNWSYKTCKAPAPIKSSPPTNQHPALYRPDALPVAQPTVSEHW